MTDLTSPPSPLREITQPFRDLIHAPRALWAVNLSYMLEGFAYFGTLTYLAMYFNQIVGLSDKHAGWMVGALTSGITFSMLIFGSRVDAWGLRRTLIVAICLMFLGRVLLALTPGLGLTGGSLGSSMNLTALGGILLIVSGFGMYQPAIYAGTRQITTAATSGMAFAMLYAVNNLGGWLPSFMSPVRRAFGMNGAIGFYAFTTLLGLTLLISLLTRKTLEKATAEAKAAATPQTETERAAAQDARDTKAAEDHARRVPVHLWVCLSLLVLLVVLVPSWKGRELLWGVEALCVAAFFLLPSGKRKGILRWLANHPLGDLKFFAFIFALIPVQTLFAYNWLVIPQYVARAFAHSTVGQNFEVAANLNALLIFILCPIVAALSVRTKVYNMMIAGTAVMAAPAFILSLGPTVWGLFAYILVLSIGEAMWQPRFLQYAAEIAPEGRTGAYMGVAQFPWFLTKMLVPIYSGIALARWCPEKGPQATGTMWFFFGCLACVSTVVLILAKGWLGKDFKTQA